MQIRAIQSILEKIVPGVFEKILRKILARVVTLSSLCNTTHYCSKGKLCIFTLGKLLNEVLGQHRSAKKYMAKSLITVGKSM